MFSIFSPPAMPRHSSFFVPNVTAAFRREPPKGALNAVGSAKIATSDQYLASSRAVNAATARCYQHGAAGPWQNVTLIAGSKRRSLLMARDDDETMTRSLNVTPKTTEQHLIVRSDKCVAYVTNKTVLNVLYY